MSNRRGKPLESIFRPISAAFMRMANGKSEDNDVPGEFFVRVRGLRRDGDFTFAACFAELAAYLDANRRYYSAAAGDCWLRSLGEYDDPKTARFRIERAIYNIARFPNAKVTEGLFHASARLYLDEDRYTDAASEYLRSIWFYLNTDRGYPPPWEYVAKTLRTVKKRWKKAGVDAGLIGEADEFMKAALLFAEAG